MKPTHLTFMVTLCCAQIAVSQTVHHSILAPDQAADIAHDGNFLWMPSGTDLYKINTQNGNEEDQYSYPFHTLFGATYDGVDLWVSDRSYGKIMRIDVNTGMVLNEYLVSALNPSGLTWDGTSLWLMTNEANQIQDSLYEINPANGQVLSRFEVLLDEPYGLGFDGTSIWCGENSAGEIHKLDPSNSISISSYTAPGGNYPNGLAYDGNYMWVCNAATDTIYKFTVGPNSINTAAPVDFVVFPNPTANDLFISGIDMKHVQAMELFDHQGRFLMNLAPTNRLSLREVQEGAYVLKVRSLTGTIAKRIIVAAPGR